MIVIVANNFAYVTLCMFSLIRLWIEKGSEVAMICINSLFWSSLYSVMIFSIAYVGHFSRREVWVSRCWHYSYFKIKLFHSQAMNTANVLHKIANRDHLGCFTERIMMFSQQLIERLPLFSCGFFSFDLSLAFKVNCAINSGLKIKHEMLILVDQRSGSLPRNPGSVWNDRRQATDWVWK